MKKVEVILHTLYENRKIYEFYDQFYDIGKMKQQEKQILSETAIKIKDNNKIATQLKEEE